MFGTENGFTDTFRIQTEDVAGYMIKGMWYFDKRQGELKYRLLALLQWVKMCKL